LNIAQDELPQRNSFELKKSSKFSEFFFFFCIRTLPADLIDFKWKPCRKHRSAVLEAKCARKSQILKSNVLGVPIGMFNVTSIYEVFEAVEATIELVAEAGLVKYRHLTHLFE
jgi:hypothetical protein